MFTIVMVYDGKSGSSYVNLVNGVLTEEQKDAWRKAHSCDQYCDEGEDDVSEMEFVEIEKVCEPGEVADSLFNASDNHHEEE